MKPKRTKKGSYEDAESQTLQDAGNIAVRTLTYEGIREEFQDSIIK